MSAGGGGKRKPVVEVYEYEDGGLLDLGDVSNDLEALTKLSRNKDRLGGLAELSEGDSAYDNLSSPGGDYDNLSSPGGSSTCSGPTYTRHVGFGPDLVRPHSQVSGPGLTPVSRTPSGPPSPLTHSISQPQIGTQSLISRHRLANQHSLENPLKENKKKKKKNLLCPAFEENGGEIRGVQVGSMGDGGLQKQKAKVTSTKLGMATSRQRHKKEPLPMKMRALPQSFWQQPNNANPLSPGAVYSTLPPLPGQAGPDTELLEHIPALADVAGEDAEELLDKRKSERTVTAANTDLLFSLFNGVEEDENQRQIHLVRRGRPKKPPPMHRTRMLQDEDPCLISNMTESILPLIPERSGNQSSQNNNNYNNNKQQGNQGTQVIKIMSISHGDRSVDLPSLNIEHNYPHLLSELVMKL
eukprot:TRINITY_DN10302_c0_g1_i1.p1 TRINITY_DN10302_c0_g1~~TRINITY_DN10302_c0_g1_i1.p1  ORF type:complete len:412 (-),score=97.72 TRINITY_DN10302_c0_g1_i1:1088-2323(-)